MSSWRHMGLTFLSRGDCEVQSAGMSHSWWDRQFGPCVIDRTQGLLGLDKRVLIVYVWGVKS